MRLLHTAGLMLNEYEQLKGWMGLAAPGIGQGSNAWAVSASKTASGRPHSLQRPPPGHDHARSMV